MLGVLDGTRTPSIPLVGSCSLSGRLAVARAIDIAMMNEYQTNADTRQEQLQ